MKKRVKVNPRRLTLRGWASLDDLRRSIDKSAKEENWSAIPDLIFRTIELCVDNFDRESFWMDAAQLYDESIKANEPTKQFPILTTKDKSKPLPWEYEGRSWFFWLHTLAKNYGWGAEEIGKLDLDDAIGLYQETLIDDQLDKEWDYGLSEIAYPYNSSTKKSVFKPMERPSWMKPIAPKNTPVRKTKIPVASMPIGNIVNLDEVHTSATQSK